MPYNMPPQTNTNMNQANQSYTQQSQDTHANKARQTATNAVQGSTLIDVQNDSTGKPAKAHVRTHDGNVKTVTFDQNQNVTQTTDGYC